MCLLAQRRIKAKWDRSSHDPLQILWWSLGMSAFGEAARSTLRFDLISSPEEKRIATLVMLPTALG
jgi:hypothetical protein